MTQDELKQFDELFEKYKSAVEKNQTIKLSDYYNHFVKAIPKLLDHITAQEQKIAELRQESVDSLSQALSANQKWSAAESENARLWEQNHKLFKQLEAKNDKLTAIINTKPNVIEFAEYPNETCHICKSMIKLAQSAIKGDDDEAK